MTHDDEQLVARHLRLGWWSLLVFLSMGGGLELLHALKVDYYVDVASDTRRLLWTLAHAHGTLLSLVHVGFAATVALTPGWTGAGRQLASRGLVLSLVLVPGGFFLGGLFIHQGDPGLGIFLLPLGFVFLFVGVLRTAQGSGTEGSPDD